MSAPRRRFFAAALAAAVLIAVAPEAVAQAGDPYVEVADSSGFAEVLLSAGWRQAVEGRRVPVGGVLTTWVDAGIRVTYLDAELELGALTQLTIASLRSDSLVVRVGVGELTATAGATKITIHAGDLAIECSECELTVGDQLDIAAGEATIVTQDGRSLVVAPGDRVELVQSSRGPILPR